MKDKLMYAGIIFVFIVILIGSSFFLGTRGEISISQPCDVVIPVWGVVQCKSTGAFENPSAQRNIVGDTIDFTINCWEECNIRSDLIQPVTCDWDRQAFAKITVAGVVQKSLIEYTNIGTFSYKLYRGQSATVAQTCGPNAVWTIGSNKLPNTGSGSVRYDSLKTMLYEGVGGTLPTSPIQGTEGCTLNNVLSTIRQKYSLQTPTATVIDPTSLQSVVKPSSTYQNMANLPANWHLTESYVYLDHYQKTYGISPVFSKSTNGYVYCSGTAGNKKVLNMVQATDPITGSCIVLPSSVAKTAECCNDVDCSFKGAGYVCNPTSWMCDNRKPCNSDLECPQSTQCVNRQSDTWRCDFAQPYGSGYSGTCTKSTRTYVQCPNECTADQYWNSQTTKCEPRSILEECGAGNCCLSGSTFKPQSCDLGKSCCTIAGSPHKGICKDSCAPSPTGCQLDSDCNDMNPQTKDTCEKGLLGNNCRYTDYCPKGQTYNPDTGTCSKDEIAFDFMLLIPILAFGGIIGAYMIMKKKR